MGGREAVIHKGVTLTLLVQDSRYLVFQDRRPDQVAQGDVGKRRCDEFGQVSSWSCDRGHAICDRVTPGRLDRLFQITGEGAVALASGLRRDLHRNSVERSVITGSVTSHECLDVLA